jgi:outer membrane protein, heavy metal efflux system
MLNRRVAAFAAVCAAAVPPCAGAAEGLTLEAALARARQHAPRILSARARAAEALARLQQRPPLRDNPSLEVMAGARRGADARDLEAGLAQTLELGGRGRARRAADAAGRDREEAEALAVERAVLRQVRSAFARALHADALAGLAATQEHTAAALHHVAERRHAAGDVAALDVNVAASALSRARAEAKGAAAAQRAALGELRVLLDVPLDEPLSLDGALGDDPVVDAGPPDLGHRPEVLALQAALAEAEAELRLGRGQAWPDVTPAIRYEREQGDRVFWAGLTVSLPVFDRGQQLRATAGARAARLRAERDALLRALAVERQTALAVHELRRAAVAELGANAERLADNEHLAGRSYEVGQIGLAELLLVRRETADARRQWLSSLLELAQARAEVESMGGTR